MASRLCARKARRYLHWLARHSESRVVEFAEHEAQDALDEVWDAIKAHHTIQPVNNDLTTLSTLRSRLEQIKGNYDANPLPELKRLIQRTEAMIRLMEIKNPTLSDGV